MANLNSNGDAFSNATVNIDSNTINIAIGDSMSVYAGLVNQVYVGNKTQFILGIQTEINLGPVDKLIAGTTSSVLFGNSYIWSKQDTAIHDSCSRWAALNNTYHGGSSAATYGKKYAENSLGKITTAGILVGYCAMLGLAIVGMEHPPFNKVNGKKEVDKRNATITIITDSLGIIIIAILKYILAKQLKVWHSFNPVSSLGLASNGITSWVFSDPDNSTTSPLAALLMQPSDVYTGTVATPLSTVENANPLINLTTQNTTSGSYITMDPKAIILRSSSTENSAQIALDAQNKAVVITDNASLTNSVMIEGELTSINRNEGSVLVNVGESGANSSLILDTTQAALVKGENGVIIDGTSVSIGNTICSMTFGPSGINLGENAIQISPATINMAGGALTILGTSGPSVIPGKTTPISQKIPSIEAKMAKYIASIEQKIDLLKERVEFLKSQEQSFIFDQQVEGSINNTDDENSEGSL